LLDWRERIKQNSDAEGSLEEAHRLLIYLHGTNCFCPTCLEIRERLRNRPKGPSVERETVPLGAGDPPDALLVIWVAQGVLGEDEDDGVRGDGT